MKRMTAIAAITSLLVGVAPAVAQTELVVAAYGGAYTEALQKNVAAFEEENNVRITWVPASGADGLAKAMAGEVDVIHADLAWAARGELQNAFVKLDPAVVANLDSLHPKARFSEYGVVTNFGEYGIAYNPALLDAEPNSWLALWDPKYAGRVTTAGFDAANIELLILMAELNGGGIDNIDPGFAKMRELSDHIDVFYSGHPQLLDLFRNEDVVMARWLRGRVDWAGEQGVDLKFAVPEEGAIGLVSTVHVVAKRPHAELAMKFVNHLLSKEGQRVYAQELGYTPARMDLDLTGVDVPYGPEVIDKLRMSDWKQIVPKMDLWNERWQKEIAQ
jgi:putative spermidine/putrescine transport system substrate-binding protein